MKAPKLIEIDKLIRAGKTASARKMLLEAVQEGYADHDRYHVASFFRRLSMPFDALKILRPYVYPTGKKLAKASVPELAEYASVLEKVGASQESAQLLKNLDAKKYPEIYLFRAFSNFAQWDYKTALKELEEYLKLEQTDKHKRIVALSNFSAALVYEKDPRAEAVLEDLIKEARKLDYHLAEGYAHLLKLEQTIYSRNWSSVEKILVKAKSFFDESELLEHLLIRKWEWVALIYREGLSEKSTKMLDEIRAQARKFKHWETLRSCEYHFAVATQDQHAWDRVYYGSPFPEFRKRLETDCKMTIKPSQSFLYGRPKDKSEKYIIPLPLLALKKSGLERGELLSHFVQLLFSDFYRPFRIAEIHAHLFNGEHFNPITSPNKVYQVVHRLKAVLHKEQVPILLEEVQGMYRLRPKKDYAVLIPLNLSETSQKKNWRKQLIDNYSTDTPFSLNQAVVLLGVNERTLQRLFGQWIEEGNLVRTGKAKNTRYSFPKAA